MLRPWRSLRLWLESRQERFSRLLKIVKEEEEFEHTYPRWSESDGERESLRGRIYGEIDFGYISQTDEYIHGFHINSCSVYYF